MIRFLRIFTAFRALEAERDSARAEAERWLNTAAALQGAAEDNKRHGQELASECDKLRGALQESETQRLILQDRLDAVMEDRTKLWGLTRECINAERTAYQSHVNLQWQKQGFGAPYPDAPHLPPHAEPKAQQEPVTRRLLPSEAVARETRRFFEGYIQGINPQQPPAA